MTIKNQYILLLFLFAIPFLASAKPDSVIITGQIKDPLKEGNIFTCKVLRPGAPLFGQTGFFQSFSTIISNGRFRLAIPPLYNWFDVTFNSFDKEGNQTFYNNGNFLETTFLLQKGDQIKLIIQPEGLIDFFGKAASRLTCQENIYSLQYLPASVGATINYLNRTKRYAEGYSYNLKFLKAQVEMKYDILNAFRDSLPTWVYRRLYSDIIGQSYRPLLYSLLAVSWGRDTAKIKAAKVFLAQLISNMPAPDSSNEAISSSSYTDVLLYKAINEITYSGPCGTVKKATFSDLFNFVSNEYKGVLRDKLLLLVFLNYARKDTDSINYLEKAFSEMKDDGNKNILKEWAINHVEGAPAYSFDLPDEKGKRFTLKDFHGKIIVADFWFYGCEGCTQVPASMANVFNKFKGNQNVVFLSINIDREKTAWERGLKTGLYTIPGSIHLSLMGLGKDNPFIKYYGYDVYPQLLIIGSDGKTISVYPPDPRIDMGKKLIEIIDSQLGLY